MSKKLAQSPEILAICNRLLRATPLQLFEAWQVLDEDQQGTMIDALLSSEKSNWETPQWLFDAMDREFGFCMDAAADASNSKLELFINREMDTLKTDWAAFQMMNGIYPYQPVFMNPPWGQRRNEKDEFEELYHFVEKARHECDNNGIESVLVLPNKVETQWFHDFSPRSTEVRFFKGRINYHFGGKPTKNGATVGTLLLVNRFQPGVTGPPRICSMSNNPKDYQVIV